MERDHAKKLNNYYRLNFNSHAHVERDTHFTALTLYYTNFNSHAHVERDANRVQGATIGKTFQLTRSRGA